jgi:tRNA pseudouridine32 synthase / 23S rRNA pseudouridine746 synthase
METGNWKPETGVFRFMNDSKKERVSFICKASDEGKKVVDLIAEKSSLSKSLIKKLMTFGGVTQGFKGKKLRVRKAKALVKDGDKIECFFDPSIDLNESYDFKRLYKSKYFGIYLKPAGALSEGTQYGDQISLLRHVEVNKRFAYPVNRVDKEIEGPVVIAYDSKAQNILQQKWRNDVIKKFIVIVKGSMEGSGEIEFSINNKFTLTKYNCLKDLDGNTLVEVSLISERKNQIQIHFEKIGHRVLEIRSYHLEFVDPYSKENIIISNG